MNTLIEKLKGAREAIVAAEAELEVAMRGIALAPRADKVTVSASLEAAFDKLRAARAALTDLESSVASER